MPLNQKYSAKRNGNYPFNTNLPVTILRFVLVNQSELTVAKFKVVNLPKPNCILTIQILPGYKKATGSLFTPKLTNHTVPGPVLCIPKTKFRPALLDSTKQLALLGQTKLQLALLD